MGDLEMFDARITAITIERAKNKTRTDLLQKLLDGGLLSEDEYSKARFVCACEYSEAVDRIIDINISPNSRP